MPATLTMPVRGAVDSKTIVPAPLLRLGRMLSPLTALVTRRTSPVVRFLVKTWRWTAWAPVPPLNEPMASKAIQTTPAESLATLGLSGDPVPVVTWVRYGWGGFGH